MVLWSYHCGLSLPSQEKAEKLRWLFVCLFVQSGKRNITPQICRNVSEGLGRHHGGISTRAHAA